MKLIVFSAHPDDIEIFMYGLVKLLLNTGADVTLVIATDGSKGSEKLTKDLADIRKKETIDALQGFSNIIFLNEEDGIVSLSKSINSKIREIILTKKPDLVLTHDPLDYHQDHRAISFFVSDSVGFKAPIIFAETLLGVNFNPEYYVDITKVFDLKIKAIKKHKSQNPKRYIEMISLMNRYRAAQCNMPFNNYVEVYRLNRIGSYVDIRNLLPPAPKIVPFSLSNPKGLI